MALADKNILITPNTSAAAGTDPTVKFTGADVSSSSTITLRVLNTGSVGTLSFEGSTGQLLSITDSFTGTIYSVNDISGIPSIEVVDTGQIKFAQYNGYISAGGSTNNTNATSTNTGILRVEGGTGISRDLYVGNIVTIAGTTDSTTTSTQGALLVSGGVGIAKSMAIGGSINAWGNVTAYYTSDIKFKKNIQDITNAVDKVSSIGGKLYEWTDEYLESQGGEHEYFRRREDFGVIAQDVEQVFPTAIRKRPDGSLAVDYEKLVALAFAAIKELRDEINKLKGIS